MLVPSPPAVNARQTSGFTVKHDQTSIWITIRSETKLYLRNHAPIVCVALLGEKQLKELAAPALARGIPEVVALNAGTRVRNTKIKTQNENSGHALAFHLSARAGNGQTIASRGTVRRGANLSSLPEGKICSRPEADGSVTRLELI